MAKKSNRRGAEQYDDIHPVDAVAARVLGTNKTKPLRNPQELRERVDRATNPKRKQALLLKAEQAEKKLRAIRKRMTGPKAETEARRALEAAKWRRESPKR